MQNLKHDPVQFHTLIQEVRIRAGHTGIHKNWIPQASVPGTPQEELIPVLISSKEPQDIVDQLYKNYFSWLFQLFRSLCRKYVGVTYKELVKERG